jgi:hypothetical protein
MLSSFADHFSRTTKIDTTHWKAQKIKISGNITRLPRNEMVAQGKLAE